MQAYNFRRFSTHHSSKTFRGFTYSSSLGFSLVDLSILESRSHRVLMYKDNVISNVRCGPALFLGTIDGAGGEDMAMKQDGVGSDLYIYICMYIYIYMHRRI